MYSIKEKDYLIKRIDGILKNIREINWEDLKISKNWRKFNFLLIHLLYLDIMIKYSFILRESRKERKKTTWGISANIESYKTERDTILAKLSFKKDPFEEKLALPL